MQKFEVTAVTPRGYCQGVVRAIRIARETAAAYPDTPVHMLGMIVHNAHVVAACRELGMSLDDIRTCVDAKVRQVKRDEGLEDEADTGSRIVTIRLGGKAQGKAV